MTMHAMLHLFTGPLPLNVQRNSRTIGIAACLGGAGVVNVAWKLRDGVYKGINHKSYGICRIHMALFREGVYTPGSAAGTGGGKVGGTGAGAGDGETAGSAPVEAGCTG